MNCVHCSSPVADEARFCHSCGSNVSDAGGQAAATASLDQSAFAHLEALLREDTKDEYVLGPMLGRGGMAVVYLATETQLSRKVALKVLPPELTFGHGVERFKREAKTAAALDHPNIIPIFRIGSSGKIFWYAMKFLEGKSLEDLLREQGSFSLKETIAILEQVADGLDYAHAHHVIHRDIKPANVMLDNRNKVIVTDFGIAKALTEGKLTATDSVIGTPYFMSPEQGMGKTVSGASDQYSVAVMAYRMLAGHVPFDGDSAIDILHQHCMFEPPTLNEDVPEIPQHVSDAVARALSKKGTERFATVHDFVQSMKDPEFVPTELPQENSATLQMTSAEVRKGRGQPPKPITTGATGKGRTAKTKGATPAGARTAATEAPPAKSRARLFATIAIAVVVIAVGGGIAAMQLSNSPVATTTLAPVTPAVTAPVTAPGATLATANQETGSAATPIRVPENKPQTNAPVPAGKPSAPVTRATVQVPPRQVPTSGAPATAPATSPATPPSTTPAATTVPAPVVTAPASSEVAAQTGTLQLVLSTPGIVEIDGKDFGEKARFQTPLTEGTHVVRVRKEGFTTITQTVEIRAGTTTPLRLTLEPRP